MNHGLFLPLLLPLLSAVGLLLIERPGRFIALRRGLSLGAGVALYFICLHLFIAAASGGFTTYALGNWPAPFGIVLVLDRLAALLLLLTSLVALAALAYAILSGTDVRGRYFHVLFQFQLLGLNGAFLTGDLFNLFVCFEILLIASYGLLLHGGGRELTRAGLHYVVLNLIGSAFFLLGIGVLYGITGTLNMADLALKIAQAEPGQAGLLRAGGLLLLVVFALKAALLPLYFWLPKAYSLTTAAVAALFAIMTKVGVYAIVRVSTLLFGEQAGAAAGVVKPWLLPLALATLVLGAIGVVAASDLRRLLAYLVVVSVGTLLTAVGLFSPSGLSAALVYLVHSTLITAGMFLLADLIARQRGTLEHQVVTLPVAQAPLLGVLFFIGAVALAGLPPFSGFFAKLMIMHAAGDSIETRGGLIGVWGILLAGGLLSLIALSRSGSALFWRTRGAPPAPEDVSLVHSLPALIMLAASPLLVLLAAPLQRFANAAAGQLFDVRAYVTAVLGPDAAAMLSMAPH